MTDESKRLCIQSWITRAVDEGTYQIFDDIHIDEIDPALAISEKWFTGSVECLSIAQDILDFAHPEFIVTVGFSLPSDSRPVGLNFSSASGLKDHYDKIRPPSLYIFRKDNLPWSRHEPRFLHVKDFKGEVGQGWEFFYSEYREPFEEDYRRSFWIARCDE